MVLMVIGEMESLDFQDSFEANWPWDSPENQDWRFKSFRNIFE